MLQDPTVQQLLQWMEQLAEQVQQQCTARELANISWSCGYLSRPGVVSLLLPRLLQPRVLQQAEAQALSNTLLGVAKSGAALAPDQLQQLLSAFSRQLVDAKPQEISNTLWAVATMGQQVPASQLLQVLSAFSRQLADAKPQEISNTLWAVATMGQQVPAKQLQALLSAFSAKLADAKPQNISNTLWAIATMGHQLSEEHLQDFVMAFTVHLEAASMQELANTLWACAKQQYAPQQLLAAVERRQHSFQQQLTTTAPMALSGIAYACGQLGYCSKLLPGALLQAAADRCRQEGAKAFGTQGLANLCWSAAVLDLQQYAPQVLELAAACSTVWSAMQPEELRQLYQVHMWLIDSQVSGGLSGVLTPQQLQQCRKEWELRLAAIAKASMLQQQVFAALQQLPPGTFRQQPVMEQRTADGAFSIDIAVTTAAGSQVAIEVDGPSHFLRPDNTLDGRTQSRNKALAARGWSVVTVPYFEWNGLQPGQQQQAYLLDKLPAVCAGDAAR